jgi:hypothetical protein
MNSSKILGSLIAVSLLPFVVYASNFPHLKTACVCYGLNNASDDLLKEYASRLGSRLPRRKVRKLKPSQLALTPGSSMASQAELTVSGSEGNSVVLLPEQTDSGVTSGVASSMASTGLANSSHPRRGEVSSERRKPAKHRH